MSRYRDPRSKRHRRPFTWRGRVVLAAFPAAFGAFVVWRGVLDPPRSSASDGIVVPILLVLSIAGVLACFGSESRAGRWFSRAGSFLAAAAVIGLAAFLVIGGLFAPGLVADPAASRAPRTEAGAFVLAILLLALLGGLLVTWYLEGRARKRRGRG